MDKCNACEELKKELAHAIRHIQWLENDIINARLPTGLSEKELYHWTRIVKEYGLKDMVDK